MTHRTEFTTAPFVRSNGKAPKGSGMWAFQASNTRVAFDDDRFGPVEMFTGTFAQARKAAGQAFAGCEFVAVCP